MGQCSKKIVFFAKNRFSGKVIWENRFFCLSCLNRFLEKIDFFLVKKSIFAH